MNDGWKPFKPDEVIRGKTEAEGRRRRTSKWEWMPEVIHCIVGSATKKMSEIVLNYENEKDNILGHGEPLFHGMERETTAKGNEENEQ